MIYYIAGVQYWRYDSENDRVFANDSLGRSYPRLISDDFPGVIGPVDTAYYDRRDAHVYFFKGSQVSVMLHFLTLHIEVTVTRIYCDRGCC